MDKLNWLMVLTCLSDPGIILLDSVLGFEKMDGKKSVFRITERRAFRGNYSFADVYSDDRERYPLTP